MAIINRLKDLRLQHKLTLKDLAKDLRDKGIFEKITDGTLSRYESGSREPKLATWQKLADYFDVDVGYLQGVHEITTDEVNDYFDAGIYHYLTSTDEKDDVIKQWLRTSVTLYEDAQSADNSELDFTFTKIFNDFFNAMATASNASKKLKGYTFQKSIELFTEAVNELEKQSKYPIFWGDASQFQDENGNFNIEKYNERFHILNDDK